MKNRDTFSGYHPTVNFLYYALVLLFSMCLMHPVYLAISLTGALAYDVYLKGKKLHIRKVSDFDKAQVTTGGVALSELQADTLELIKYPGIYVTGELADVDGICGGYNLQWAWSSGHLAGQSAACALKTKIRSRS